MHNRRYCHLQLGQHCVQVLCRWALSGHLLAAVHFDGVDLQEFPLVKQRVDRLRNRIVCQKRAHHRELMCQGMEDRKTLG